ncbi:caspase-2 isoform X1 [Syngnathoides biaculeatus]|uniref:caspase-2 isoform X1 n=1 Tax=Syngnathoides biaculeatus TaxID=300417 RepID=UPI002ADE8F20|nr:caspase-2 isoform X1 [Syngnathoides biaculeatus]XP_061675763.1 caspase-2 isoform X1 [Syngnathoides biaculeatus]
MRECGMKEGDRVALKSRCTDLCKQLVVDELLIQCLLEDNILTDSMAESILAEQTSHKRSFRLLLLLPKRGPQAFSSFCSALKETEQRHLCELLTGSQEADGEEARGFQTEEEFEGRAGRQLMQTSGRRRESNGDSSLPLSTEEETAAKRARTHESMEYSLDADSPITTPVLPCTHELYLSQCQKSYIMTSSPRGLALVISNVTFDPRTAPDLDPRKGGEVDDEVLRKVFKDLDYLVTVCRNLTAEEMRSCIEKFRMLPKHRTVNSCVVCLLSHGVDGAVYGTDGQLLQLEWVFEAFDNVRCPLLQNKPKMFFIQACRGEELDCGVEQMDGPGRSNSPSCEQRDAGREGPGGAGARHGGGDLGLPRIKLPQRSDMICGFASLKGQRICTAAMRNTKRGSWFIQELNSALRLRARDTHVADILVQVNGKIKEREGYAPGTPHHRCKEMSEFTSSLCKDLYLFPKYQPHCS